jgi:hypothetical protein
MNSLVGAICTMHQNNIDIGLPVWRLLGYVGAGKPVIFMPDEE